jgi:SAM-dependent methyltransferase
MRRRVHNTIDACGYTTNTAKMFSSTNSELSVYDIQPKEVIAEIGFGTGWLTGVMLIRYDSLTYYANDIDEASLKAIDPITKKYLGLRKTPNTNTLIVVKGTTTRTNLPENTFDKIIVREAFHHFESPNDMLQDIKKLLKSNGKLFVYEPNVEKTFFSNECGSNNYSKADILKFFSENNFSLVSEHDLLDSPGNIPSWYARSQDKIKPKKIFVFTNR